MRLVFFRKERKKPFSRTSKFRSLDTPHGIYMRSIKNDDDDDGIIIMRGAEVTERKYQLFSGKRSCTTAEMIKRFVYVVILLSYARHRRPTPSVILYTAARSHGSSRVVAAVRGDK